MNNRLIALLMTLVASAGLLGLGYQYGTEKVNKQLEICRRLAKQQAERANRLASENQLLKRSLTQLQTPDPPKVPKASPQTPPQMNRRLITLHRGRAFINDDHTFSMTLEDLASNPKRVAIRVETPARKPETIILGAGAKTGIKLQGRTITLVVKEIHASSATVILLGL